MLHLYGIPVHPGEARALIAMLAVVATPHARSAALAIERKLGRGGGLVPLTPQERDAVLAALPPDSNAQLRGAMIRDHERRNGAPPAA